MPAGLPRPIPYCYLKNELKDTMALSKLEIQQMLREMNVKFSADDTLDELKQRLQQENHSLWLKSVSGSRTADGKSNKVVVRKRKKVTPAQDPEIDSPAAETHSQPHPSTMRTASPRPQRPEPDVRPPKIEMPAPGKPWKAAADGTEPFNRKKKVFDSVLKRARMCCEHCGRQADDKSGTTDLQPFHILPLTEGGEHSIKNVVALCPTCMDVMQNEPDPKDIKELKRKTRTKIYDSLQVLRKKKVDKRRRHPGRRK
jgi:5-methylcytosine-specific restriction enzyme A